MRHYVATVTSKGQLTLPVEIRRRLGIEAGDKVTFVLDDERGARLRRVEHTVESVRGLIPTPPWMEGRDLDEMIEEATLDHADEFVRRMREGSA